MSLKPSPSPHVPISPFFTRHLFPWAAASSATGTASLLKASVVAARQSAVIQFGSCPSMPEALVLPSTAAVVVGTSADPAGQRLWLPLGFFNFHLLYILNNGFSSLIEYMQLHADFIQKVDSS
jgi:hypothetical protein